MSLHNQSHTVVLYGRDGCHLCDEALAVLQRVREELPFVLLERDIDMDERTHRAYFERIPVIMLDGKELFDYFVDETVLRERLAAPAADPLAAPAAGALGARVVGRVEFGQ
jgi:glutaredoxin